MMHESSIRWMDSDKRTDHSLLYAKEMKSIMIDASGYPSVLS